MTTEPKDVRGGYFAQQNETKTPSDPPPVREAVAWRWPLTDNDGKPTDTFDVTVSEKYAALIRDTGSTTVQPLYPDPLPVSREAVARAIAKAEGVTWDGKTVSYAHVPGSDDDGPIDRYFRAADAILALTGETSRE